MKTIICCLFALSFFVIVTGRNMPSTALSSDVNLNDPPLPFLPPPPPSPLVNGGVVVPQTPSLSKPPSPVVNSDSDSQINKKEKILIILDYNSSCCFNGVFNCIFYVSLLFIPWLIKENLYLCDFTFYAMSNQ
ncbi:transmembrane protein, putative [Medicago truncatula]|nr:transmembrane protein, putative [Medicago truncatula]